uniref:Interleukin 17c n=1 Tax=Anabas testudineus TaxID=64144 RepID=A0AAQ6IFC3_ANATE
MLKKILLGSLLILSDHTSSAKKVSCISEDKLTKRTGGFLRKYWNKTSLSKILDAPQDAGTCEQAAMEMNGAVSSRALSPWRFHLDRDENRFPIEISFAECLCEGCIIKKRHEMAYNSVLVFAELMVLKKTPCPYDPTQHVVRKEFIKVPVACTCVVPKYAK